MNKKFVFYKNFHFVDISLNSEFDFFLFRPKFLKLRLHSDKNKKSFWLYLIWYLFTLGEYRILYIYSKKNNELAHFSNVVPGFFKYSFISQNDMQIANCYTYKKYRRKGFYVFAISEIQRVFGKKRIWIGSESSNLESIKAIEKMGFKKMLKAKRSFFGVYYKIDE